MTAELQMRQTLAARVAEAEAAVVEMALDPNVASLKGALSRFNAGITKLWQITPDGVAGGKHRGGGLFAGG